MVDIESRKKHIQTLIDLNPIEVTLHKTVREISADGGFSTTELSVGPITARIFYNKSTETIVTEAGTEVHTPFKLLALADLGLINSVMERCTLTCSMGTMEIAEILPLEAQGQLYGYQCALIEVS